MNAPVSLATPASPTPQPATLQTIRANLQTVIANKTSLYRKLVSAEDLVSTVTCQFLTVNLVELRNILEHVEACIAAQSAASAPALGA